ncbi:MAG TPA: TonB-dependent receptor [Gemmatimonadales bacterium]|nr:TonB-dependent receptor [Gemmatimonadales bacterium]
MLLAPAGLGAQAEPGLILRGSIVAADGRTPLPGALVELIDLDLRTSTDLRGRFAIGPVPAGTHRVRVLRVGYEGMTTTVEVTTSAAPQLHLEMTRSAVEMDPLQVLASRTRMVGDALAEVPLYGAAHLITAERIQSPEFVFGNIHDLLRTVPGVNLQEEDGYGLRPNIGLRGSGTERSSKITLMEDGVLIAPAPYAAPAAYYFPTAARMHAVEVRAGASQIRYGPRTTGGAINLVSTPIPDALKWSLEAAGGSEGTLRTQGRVGSAGRHVGWMVEGFRLETNGFKELESGASTGFLLQDYVAKIRVNTDRSGPVYQQLELKAGYNDEISHETYLGLTDADFQSTPLQRYPASEPDLMDAEQSQVQLRHFISSRRWDVTTTAYRHDFSRNWYKLQSVQGKGLSTVLADPEAHAASLAILKGATSSDNALRLRANNREYYAHGIQTTAGFRFTSRALRHNIEVGARIHRDAEDRLQWDDGYRMVGGRMERTSQGAPGSQDNRVGMADAVAVFLQDEITIGRWSLTPGLRHEKVDFTQTRYATTDPERTTPTDVRENGVSAWIPGLSVAARAGDGLEVFAGLHRGFGPPGPGANVATRAELSWNYEAGARLSRPGMHAQLSAYLSDYSNILGVATLANSGDGSGDAFNGGSVLVKGLEANLEVDLLSSARQGDLSLPLSLSYSLTDAQFRSNFESGFDSWGKVVIGDQLPYVATSQFSASFGVANQKGRVMASLTGSSPVRTKAGQGPRDPASSVDGFVTASLSGEWRLPGAMTVFSAVQNLTDARYAVARRPAGLRPGLPRTVVLGIRLAR